MTVPAPLRFVASAWREARRYAVPPAMVRTATTRREAGDTVGACDAAAVDLLIDMAEVRRTRGAEVADRLADDLRHLAPDLLRWHLPWRMGGSRTVLTTGVTITLARYGGDALHLTTPRPLDARPRPVLRFGPLGPEAPLGQTLRWDRHRHLWDVRAAGELYARIGGRGRLPFHATGGRLLDPAELPTERQDDPVALIEWTTTLLDAGRQAEAWAACGIALDAPGPAEADGAAAEAVVPLVRDALGTLPAAMLMPSGGSGWYRGPLVLSRSAGTIEARVLKRDVPVPDLPVLPGPAWRRAPDLELLRLGRIRPAELHPLVRHALFPGLDAEYRPVGAGATDEIRVRCRSAWHRVGWRAGRVHLRDHAPEEARREQAMRALGAPTPGCFSIEDTWRGGPAGRLPRRLRELHRHAVAAAWHGDVDTLTSLLDDGVDVTGIRCGEGRTLLHVLAHLDRPGLLHRLRAAGLHLEATDDFWRTPLFSAIRYGASAAVVRGLLDAGARTDVTDLAGATLLHVLTSPDAATILPWLLAAGLRLEETDTNGRTPLLEQIWHASPEAIRALLDAGADVRAGDDTRFGVVSRIGSTRRTDLGFVIEAHRKATG